MIPEDDEQGWLLVGDDLHEILNETAVMISDGCETGPLFGYGKTK